MPPGAPAPQGGHSQGTLTLEGAGWAVGSPEGLEMSFLSFDFMPLSNFRFTIQKDRCLFKTLLWLLIPRRIKIQTQLWPTGLSSLILLLLLYVMVTLPPFYSSSSPNSVLPRDFCKHCLLFLECVSFPFFFSGHLLDLTIKRIFFLLCLLIVAH